jgi:hypothetical protein
MTTCNSCQAEVIFVPSAKTGRSMILDAKPTKGVVIGMPDSRSWFFTPADGPDGPGSLMARAKVVDVYTDHHVTCPNADDWKGRTRKDPPT